jgi:hypothetical protein
MLRRDSLNEIGFGHVQLAGLLVLAGMSEEVGSDLLGQTGLLDGGADQRLFDSFCYARHGHNRAKSILYARQNSLKESKQ